MTDPGQDSNIHLVSDGYLVELYRTIARKVGVADVDIQSVFALPSSEVAGLVKGPTTIEFLLADEHKADFQCAMGANAMVLVGESQRNKTTSLLVVATLLGYDWDRAEALRFLGDEEFVKKGQLLRKTLSHGREASLAIVRGDASLRVQAKGGRIVVTRGSVSRETEQHFDVTSDWGPFEHHMDALVDVQVVSKGRNFLERVESDILDNLKRLGEALDENGKRERGRLMLLSARQGPGGTHLDRTAIEHRLRELDTELRQRDGQRTHFSTQLAVIHELEAHLSTLFESGEHQKLEEAYRLEQLVQAAERAEGEKANQLNLVHQSEQEVQQLTSQQQGLLRRKQAIDEAFASLQSELDALVDSGRLSGSSELEEIGQAVDVADVRAVCEIVPSGVGGASVNVYRALIGAMQDIGSPDVVLLPIDGVSTSGELLAHLRDHLRKASNLVAISEAVTGFAGRLQDAGVPTGTTPYDYQNLEQSISQATEALRSAVALLQERRETLEALGTGRDVQGVRERLAEVTGSLSPEAVDIKERVFDAVRILEGDLATHLAKVWSGNALAYVQDLSARMSTVSQRLRRQQLEAQQEHTELLRVLESQSPANAEDLVERAEKIRSFTEQIHYVTVVADARTAEQRRTPDVQEAFRHLRQAGLDDLLKASIDKLIATRCAFYYDNRSDPCRRLPLEAVIYEQTDRAEQRFTVGGVEFDRSSLSGGTESVMTVRSLASRLSAKPLGMVLLVDEWGDVEQMGRPLFDELADMPHVLAAIFVRVERVPTLTATAVN